MNSNCLGSRSHNRSGTARCRGRVTGCHVLYAYTSGLYGYRARRCRFTRSSPQPQSSCLPCGYPARTERQPRGTAAVTSRSCSAEPDRVTTLPAGRTNARPIPIRRSVVDPEVDERSALFAQSRPVGAVPGMSSCGQRMRGVRVLARTPRMPCPLTPENTCGTITGRVRPAGRAWQKVRRACRREAPSAAMSGPGLRPFRTGRYECSFTKQGKRARGHRNR